MIPEEQKNMTTQWCSTGRLFTAATQALNTSCSNTKGDIKILEDATVHSAHLLGYGDVFWYQDDGAPCHRAKIVNAWKEENGLKMSTVATTVPRSEPNKDFKGWH